MSPPGAGEPQHPPDRRRGPQQRTTPRGELARNPRFADISPEVGVLDVEAFEEAMAGDPDAALELLVDMAGATDEALRAAARTLAARIVLDLARRGPATRSGVGRLRTVPGAEGGDLDVDASLDVLVTARAVGVVPEAEDLSVRVWARPELALCLVIDRSGSMGGVRLAAAALAAGACAWRAPGEHAVLSFAAGVDVLRGMNSERPAVAVVDAILALRGHGTTDLAGALRAASAQLERSRAARRVVVLLSDCRASDDTDCAPVAARLPELVILAPAEDSDAAVELARRSGARWAGLHGAADAPAALLTLLG